MREATKVTRTVRSAANAQILQARLSNAIPALPGIMLEARVMARADRGGTHHAERPQRFEVVTAQVSLAERADVVLTGDESRELMDLLKKPPKPTDALRSAMARRR